jgi:hypothetical protein
MLSFIFKRAKVQKKPNKEKNNMAWIGGFPRIQWVKSA